MGILRRGASIESMPVFYDPTGKRFMRVLLCMCIATLVTGSTSYWIAPQAIAPLWSQQLHQEREYPRKFLAHLDIKSLPVLNERGAGLLDRIVRIDRQNGIVNLADPFSNTIYREATEEEREELKNASYAVLHFGMVPDRQLMLTFDDGPDPVYTPMILDILSREKVPATFFVMGENVAEHPDVLNRIIREGHMVANHTATHIEFDAESDLRNRVEIIGTDRVIRAASGYETKLFRIPRGDPDGNLLALLQSQQLGYLHVNFDLDTWDWKFAPGKTIPAPALDGKGHIVLMHDGGGDRSGTVKMLERFIADAKRQGYSFTTIAPLLPHEYVPRTDTNVTMADYATLSAAKLMWVVPKQLFTWLFWFGVGSLTIMSFFYLIMACADEVRKRRFTQTPVPEWKLLYVSVVIAAFNEEKVIRRTLDSIRACDYPAEKLEVIVVNDGSRDKTGEVLDAYTREWPLLRVIHQKNTGKSKAVNNGIAQTREETEVIVSQDADTIFEPYTIRLLAEHFVRSSHRKDTRPVGAVAGHVKVGNRRNVITAWQSLEYISGVCLTRKAEGCVNAIAIVPGACSAWSRRALREIGGFSEDTLAEDADATLELHRRQYQVLQDNRAVCYTEAPESIHALAKQRLRWTFGNTQVLWKHRGMLLRPKYGMLGMVSLPYAALSLLVPLIFLPPTVITAVISLTAGNWESVALFAVFVMVLHLLISIAAIIFARECMWHLLIVPVYRLIYEPLRAYLLYASFVRIVRGSAVGWKKLERLNSMTVRSAG